MKLDRNGHSSSSMLQEVIRDQMNLDAVIAVDTKIDPHRIPHDPGLFYPLAPSFFEAVNRFHLQNNKLFFEKAVEDLGSYLIVIINNSLQTDLVKKTYYLRRAQEKLAAMKKIQTLFAPQVREIENNLGHPFYGDWEKIKSKMEMLDDVLTDFISINGDPLDYLLSLANSLADQCSSPENPISQEPWYLQFCSDDQEVKNQFNHALRSIANYPGPNPTTAILGNSRSAKCHFIGSFGAVFMKGPPDGRPDKFKISASDVKLEIMDDCSANCTSQQFQLGQKDLENLLALMREN